MALKEFLFSTFRLGHKVFAGLPILYIAGSKERENWIILYQKENIYPSALVWEESVFKIGLVKLLVYILKIMTKTSNRQFSCI